jgi:hypothetical protein
MPLQVVDGAQIMCSFGTSPSSLTILPVNRTKSTTPTATILDNIPMVNIMPFGMCITPSNPQVAAATSAALGVLTPQPCIPVTASPWAPGAAQTIVAVAPALHEACTCNCMWGGVISVIFAGQTQKTVN